MSRLTEFEVDGRSLVREVFIETGTYEGETLGHALAAGFRVCHSVEVNPELAERARRRFTAYPQVHIHRGTSPTILPSIIDPERATTFWLDAHYQGGPRSDPWPAELFHFDERQWLGIDEITDGLPGYRLSEHAGILCFFSS